MACRICGDEQGRWYEAQRQSLCVSCLADTPAKVEKGLFDRLYWGDDWQSVRYVTRRDFYEDYLASTVGDVSVYLAQTTA